MRNVIIATGLVLILILTCFTSLTIYSHNTRQNEVEEALTAAVEQTLENLKVKKQYSIANTEEFIADFTQRLVLGVDSESNITVNILAVDMDKGLLDVEVVETYRQVNGSVGKASYRKTVIFDEALPACSVVFMVQRSYASGDFEEYKTFTMTHGEKAILPTVTCEGNPYFSGYSEHDFVGWSLTKPSAENEYSPEVVSELIVYEDTVLYAVFD